MDEPDVIPCTALDAERDGDSPNILMHPPCACPRCAPDPVEAPDDGWLTISEDAQRFRVENAELGATGTKLLG